MTSEFFRITDEIIKTIKDTTEKKLYSSPVQGRKVFN